MSTPAPALLQTMQRASALLRAGNFVAARAALEHVVAMSPRFVEGHRLLGGALQALGDMRGAESELRTAIQIDPNWAPAQTALGELLVDSGRLAEAENCLRIACAANQAYPRATLVLADLLNRLQRGAETLELTEVSAASAAPDIDVLMHRVVALASLGRQNDVVNAARRILRLVPDHALAEVHLAAALDALGEHGDAVNHADRAIRSGADSAAAHYIHGRALLASDRFDAAEHAFRVALSLDPLHTDAQRELAQLIWMRTGDLERASETLDATLRAHLDNDALLATKAVLFDGGGNPRAAHALLHERADAPNASVGLLLTAAQAALKFNARLAHAHALRATQIAPQDALARRLLADTCLACGAPDEALRLVEQNLASAPDDQHLIAVQTTAWRMLGDARYGEYCDYAEMARAWRIDIPPGWGNLDAYLGDLASSLARLHQLRAHPLHQSLRHGSQTTQNLMRSKDPAIAAFFVAIDGPIRRHIATIGRGTDPLRRRNLGGAGTGYRMNGVWSVRLRSQGFHTNHVHPQGWLSSACYIALPQATLREPTSAELTAEHPGWLKFGEPGISTDPPLPAQHFIRPQPGTLALFPSYFWHGTVPFDGDDTRLTIAFDLLPGAEL